MTKETVVKIVYVLTLVCALLFIVSPFIVPIFFAATISLTLHPILEWLVLKGMKRNRAAALLTSLFGLVISFPVFFFVIKGTIAVTKKLEELSLDVKLKEQGVKAVVSDIRLDVISFIQNLASEFNFLDFLTEERISEYLRLVNFHLLSYLKSFAGQIPTYFLLLLIMILCTYSFLAHAHEVRVFLRKVSGLSPECMEKLTWIFIKDSRQVYLTNITTGGIQSLIVASTVALLQLGDFFVIFFITLILSFIPVIGASPVAFVFAFISLITGKITPAIVLFAVGAFTGIIDNILRPWLASFGQSRIPTVVAFICVIGGVLWLGFPGLFVGLLLGTIAYDTLPIFWEELRFHTQDKSQA